MTDESAINSVEVVNHLLRHYAGQGEFSLNETVTVQDSKIHCLGTDKESIGRGLVALRRIQENELCALYSGVVRSYDEIQRSAQLLSEKQSLGTYLLALGGSGDEEVLARAEPGNYFASRYVVDGRGELAEQSLGIYANHQCVNRIVYFDDLHLNESIGDKRATKDNVRHLAEELGTTEITFARFIDRLTDDETEESVLAVLNDNYDRVKNKPLACASNEVIRRWEFFDYINVDEDGPFRGEHFRLSSYAILIRYYNARFALLPPALTMAVFYDAQRREFVRTERAARIFFLDGQATCMAYALLAERRIEPHEEIVIDYGPEYSNAEGNYLPSESLDKYLYEERTSTPFNVASQVLVGNVTALDVQLKRDYLLLVDFLVETAELLLRISNELYVNKWYTQQLLNRWVQKYNLPLASLTEPEQSFLKLRRLADRLGQTRVLVANDCQRLRRRLLRSACINYEGLLFFGERGYTQRVIKEKARLDKRINSSIEKLQGGELNGDNLYMLVERLARRQEKMAPLSETAITQQMSANWEKFSTFHTLALPGDSNFIFRDVFFLPMSENDFVEPTLRALSSRLLEKSSLDVIFDRCTALTDGLIAKLQLPPDEDEEVCESTNVLEAHFVHHLSEFVNTRRWQHFLLLRRYYMHLNLTLRLLPTLDLDREWLHRLYEKNYRRFFYAHQMLAASIMGDRLVLEMRAPTLSDLSDVAIERWNLDELMLDPLDETMQRLNTVAALSRWAARVLQERDEARRQRAYNAFNFAYMIGESPRCHLGSIKSLARLSQDGDIYEYQATPGGLVQAIKQFNSKSKDVEKAANEFNAYKALMENRLLGRWFLRPYNFCRHKKRYRLMYEKFDTTLADNAKQKVSRRFSEQDDAEETVKVSVELQTLYHLLQVLQNAKLRAGLTHDDLRPQNIGIVQGDSKRYIIYDFDQSRVSLDEKNDAFSFSEKGVEHFSRLLKAAGVKIVRDTYSAQLEEVMREARLRVPSNPIVPLSEADLAPYPHDDPDPEEDNAEPLIIFDSEGEEPVEVVVENAGEISFVEPEPEPEEPLIIIDNVGEIVIEEAPVIPVYRSTLVRYDGFIDVYIDLKPDKYVPTVPGRADTDLGFFSFTCPEPPSGKVRKQFHNVIRYYQVRFLRGKDDTVERLNRHYLINQRLGSHDDILEICNAYEDYKRYDSGHQGRHKVMGPVRMRWTDAKKRNYIAFVGKDATDDRFQQITAYKVIPKAINMKKLERGSDAAIQLLREIFSLYRRLRRTEGLLCLQYAVAAVAIVDRRLRVIKLDDCVLSDAYKVTRENDPGYVLGERRNNTVKDRRALSNMTEEEEQTLASLLRLFITFMLGEDFKIPHGDKPHGLVSITNTIGRAYGDLRFTDLLLPLKAPTEEDRRKPVEKVREFIMDAYKKAENVRPSKRGVTQKAPKRKKGESERTVK